MSGLFDENSKEEVTRGEDEVVPDSVTLLITRVKDYMKLKRFDECLKVTETLLNLDSRHVEGIHCKATALIELSRYGEAVAIIRGIIRELPISEQKMELFYLLKEAEGLVKQSETGEGYDFKSLIEEPAVTGRRMAEFTKRVKVVKVREGNCGLVATEDIGAGQLILVCKAVTLTTVDRCSSTDSDSTKTNVQKTMSMNHCKNTDLALIKRPDAIEIFAKLRAYLDPGHNNDESALDPDVTDMMTRYRKILGNSFFYRYHVCPDDYGVGSEDFTGTINIYQDSVLGLWIPSAYINHSCIDGNGFVQCYGEYQFIRACKLIKAEEEILISYVNPRLKYEDRQGMLEKYGLRNQCNCRLCMIDREEPSDVHAQREQLLKKYWETERMSHQQVIEIYRELEGLRTEPQLNVFLNPMFPVIYQALCRSKDRSHLSNFMERMYKMQFGSPLTADAVMTSMVQLLTTYEYRGRRAEKAKIKWAQRFKEALLVRYGSGSTEFAMYHLQSILKSKVIQQPERYVAPMNNLITEVEMLLKTINL